MRLLDIAKYGWKALWIEHSAIETTIGPTVLKLHMLKLGPDLLPFFAIA